MENKIIKTKYKVMKKEQINGEVVEVTLMDYDTLEQAAQFIENRNNNDLYIVKEDVVWSTIM